MIKSIRLPADGTAEEWADIIRRELRDEGIDPGSIYPVSYGSPVETVKDAPFATTFCYDFPVAEILPGHEVREVPPIVPLPSSDGDVENALREWHRAVFPDHVITVKSKS